MTGENQGDQKKNAARKLGRGLNALLSVPVEINLAGAPSRNPVTGEEPRDARGSRANSPSELGASAVSMPPVAAPPASMPQSSASLGGADAGVPPAGVPRGTARPEMGGAASWSSAVPVPSEGRADVPRGTREPRGEGSGGEVALLGVDQLRPNPRQPRQDFDDAALAGLAESIRTAGLMQPIVVRTIADGSYEIVAGERRWRAARRLGLASIPAIVRDIDDQTAAEWALIENIQREDLNPMDRASALRRLAEEFQLTHQQLGERVGLDRATVSNLLRLADLDPFTADAVRRGKLTQGHAKALLAVSRVDHRQTLAAAAISGDWSVRELERRVQHTNRQIDPAQRVSAAASAVKGSAHLEDLERRLSEYLGSRVTIQLGRKKGSGRIAIDFFTLDQFDGVVAKMGFVDRG